MNMTTKGDPTHELTDKESILRIFNYKKPITFFIYPQSGRPFLSILKKQFLGDPCSKNDFTKIKTYFENQLQQTEEILSGIRLFATAEPKDMLDMKSFMISLQYSKTQIPLYDFLAELFSHVDVSKFDMNLTFDKTAILTVSPK